MVEEKLEKTSSMTIIVIIMAILLIFLFSVAVYMIVDLVDVSVKYGGFATAMKLGTLFQAFYATVCGVLGKIIYELRSKKLSL